MIAPNRSAYEFRSALGAGGMGEAVIETQILENGDGRTRSADGGAFRLRVRSVRRARQRREATGRFQRFLMMSDELKRLAPVTS